MCLRSRSRSNPELFIQFSSIFGCRAIIKKVFRKHCATNCVELILLNGVGVRTHTLIESYGSAQVYNCPLTPTYRLLFHWGFSHSSCSWIAILFWWWLSSPEIDMLSLSLYLYKIWSKPWIILGLSHKINIRWVKISSISIDNWIKIHWMSSPWCSLFVSTLYPIIEPSLVSNSSKLYINHGRQKPFRTSNFSEDNRNPN